MEANDAEAIPEPPLETQAREHTPAEAAHGDGEDEGEGEVVGETPNRDATKFDFIFDDEKKKKKKAKKSKKENVQKSYNRAHYEALILNFNQQLSDLRQIFSRKDEVNMKLAKDLATIEEDRVDVCEHLERTLNKRDSQIVELEQTYERLQHECNDYKNMSRQRIDELQKLFASTEKQLKSEIELQRCALSSLNEFRLRRDAVLDGYKTTHAHVEDMDRQCKEDLFNIEQKNTVQKNVLKKEIKMRLQQVAEDFLHSSEIRNAGYTRNLIRENITLHKTLDRRVKQNICIMEEREKQFLKTKEVMESYSSLEQFTEHLEHTIKNKNAIIKRLTGRIERMKTKFIDARRYRNLCDKATEKGLFKSASPHNLNDMHAHLERLKSDKFALYWLTYHQEPEIERLRQVLDKLMSSVFMVVKALRCAEDESVGALSDPEIRDMQVVLRQNIVSELIPIVSGTTPGDGESEEEQNATAIYRPGLCGFVPPKHQLCEVMMTEMHDNAKSEISLAPSSKESMSLCGLEFGSCCYYSHTPSVRSSSILSPILECSSEQSIVESSSFADKYFQMRCSCPKKKDVDDRGGVNKIIFREPNRNMKSSRSFQNQSANCCGLDCYPYCSDSSIQEDKAAKSVKTSPSSVTFGSTKSRKTERSTQNSSKKDFKCKCY